MAIPTGTPCDPHQHATRPSRLKNFLFPHLTRRFFLRAALVALVTYILFAHVFMFARIRGASMEPTYRDGGFLLCWRRHDASRLPDRHDIVCLRLAGPHVMYLKRVVAFAGETVEFRSGVLHVNNTPLAEPYLKLACDWDSEPVVVQTNRLYVVGDNRSVPMGSHKHGQVDRKRIVGEPVL